MYRNVYGLDLGSSEIKIYDEKQNKIWKEKSAVAVLANGKYSAYGAAACHIEDAEVVYPLKGGAVASIPAFTYLLRELLGPGRSLLQSPQYLAAVPAGLTEIERRTFESLFDVIGCRRKDLRLVERSYLEAAGCGIHFEEAPGLVMVNLGAETIEIAILSYGEQILTRRLKSGARVMNRAIEESVLRRYGIWIQESQAALLRKTFGLDDGRTAASLIVSGMDRTDGRAVRQQISAELTGEACRKAAEELLMVLQDMFSRIPPEVYAGICRKGMCLTGGLARLKGLYSWLESRTGIPVIRVQEPELAAVRGFQELTALAGQKKKSIFNV